MLSKYGDFILEQKLINEDLECSYDFLQKLGEVSDRGSLIATILFRAFSISMEMDPLPQNYIDIGDGDDKITFLADARLLRLQDQNRELDPYIVRGRGNIGIGRFARSLFRNTQFIQNAGDQILQKIPKGGFKDSDFENFVNIYKSLYTKSNNQFKFVTGEDIRKYYLEDNYAASQGQLGNSCMRYESCQDYLDIYVENEESCRLLILLNGEDKICGRAIVWKLSKSPCEAEYFMDRVYTIVDSDVLKFIDIAEKEGWLYKQRMNSERVNNIIFLYKGELILGQIETPLSSVEFDRYPFMDTVAYVDIENHIGSNVNGKGRYECTSITGGYSTCYLCGGSGIASGECPNCYGRGKDECEVCNGNGSVKCKTCNGTGTTGNIITCPDCNGSGRVMKKVRMGKCNKCESSGKVSEDCPDCGGSGMVDCSFCQGTGTMDCKVCDGEGILKDKECPNCVNAYKDILEYNIIVASPDVKALAKAELHKLSS
jgi:hypothetical protein